MVETPRPDVDLIITFCASKKAHLTKQQTRDEVRKAEQQYSRLISILTYAGLKAVGRRGEALGHLLVFVKCPPKRVMELVKKERSVSLISSHTHTDVKRQTIRLPVRLASHTRVDIPSAFARRQNSFNPQLYYVVAERWGPRSIPRFP